MNFPHLSVKWSGWIHLRQAFFFSFSGKKRTSFSLISQTRGKKDTWSQVKWVSDTSPRCIDREGLGRSEASQRLHFVGGSLLGQLVLSTYSGEEDFFQSSEQTNDHDFFMNVGLMMCSTFSRCWSSLRCQWCKTFCPCPPCTQSPLQLCSNGVTDGSPYDQIPRRCSIWTYSADHR